jgi:hypothetical protein
MWQQTRFNFSKIFVRKAKLSELARKFPQNGFLNFLLVKQIFRYH